jgi:hypothetical protein
MSARMRDKADLVLEDIRARAENRINVTVQSCGIPPLGAHSRGESGRPDIMSSFSP